MINDYKPNDFVAATLNSAGKLTLDDFKAYDLTPDNTGIKDENYYNEHIFAFSILSLTVISKVLTFFPSLYNAK